MKARIYIFQRLLAWIVMVMALPAAAQADSWREAGRPGVLCSVGWPTTYALVDAGHAVLFGASRGADLDALKAHGVASVDLVLLTHHHRDSCCRAGEWTAKGIPVRAPRASAPWIEPRQVAGFWQRALPKPAVGQEPPLKERSFNEWDYFVLPEGFNDVRCDLEPGQAIPFRGWTITPITAPGHSRDQMAYAAQRTGADKDREAEGPLLFCGDALFEPGRLWSPFTTDWEHWTGKGLEAASETLHAIAELRPNALFPEHGSPILKDTVAALERTASHTSEAAFHKNFERYSKERLGQPPKVAFLAPEQVATAGEKPWSRLSERLYLTGNTYALISREGPILLIDAYGPTLAEQVEKLRAEIQAGPVEVVLLSHAHNDHYLGIYRLPRRESFETWFLEQVAEPVSSPHRYLAPYLDARPLRVDRRLADGQTVQWHEYRLTFHHLPGQTTFHMGLEFTVDGHRCFHTGDNFYHVDQFSGSGGWSGRNRGLPLKYASSARLVFEARPDWVLCAHGGAMEFNSEDFERRVRWANAASAAADALSAGGDHGEAWDPQLARVEPIRSTAKRAAQHRVTLIVRNPRSTARRLTLRLEGRGMLDDWRGEISASPGERASLEISLRVRPDAAAGRHVFPIVALDEAGEIPSDLFFVLDVE